MSRVSRAVDIMHAGLPYDVLKQAVPIHPTVSEFIPVMLGEMRPAPLHELSRTAGEGSAVAVSAGK